MEKTQNLVVNGGLKLPIGYRFYPTDEELVVHYLKKKVLGLPLPASIIPHFDVFQTDPWSLPGDLKEKRYFFSKNYSNGGKEKKVRISAGSGCWRSNGKQKHILASASGLSTQQVIIGLRKTLVFYHGRNNSNKISHAKTPWIMHEYQLVGANPNSTQVIPKMGLENWVIYQIFQRKRKPNNKKHAVIVSSKTPVTDPTVVAVPSCIDFTVDKSHSDFIGPPQPSDSSEVDNIIGGDDQEDIISGSFPSSCFNFMRK